MASSGSGGNAGSSHWVAIAIALITTIGVVIAAIVGGPHVVVILQDQGRATVIPPTVIPPTVIPPTVIPPTAQSSTVGYPISAEQAGMLALAGAPGATLTGAPTLVSFQGVIAYKVPLDAGMAYVDATSGQVIAISNK